MWPALGSGVPSIERAFTILHFSAIRVRLVTRVSVKTNVRPVGRAVGNETIDYRNSSTIGSKTCSLYLGETVAATGIITGIGTIVARLSGPSEGQWPPVGDVTGIAVVETIIGYRVSEPGPFKGVLWEVTTTGVPATTMLAATRGVFVVGGARGWDFPFSL